jgi:hypothetical protein
MFSASVWGDVWGPEASNLDVSGGSNMRSDGKFDFLIWEMPHELKTRDRMAFFFEEGSKSSRPGTIFESEATTATETSKMPSHALEEELAEMESRPTFNAALTWIFSVNGGPSIRVSPDHSRQHIGLHTVWNKDRPERLRINLSKSSLREIADRGEGEQLFLEYVPLGTAFELAIGA